MAFISDVKRAAYSINRDIQRSFRDLEQTVQPDEFSVETQKPAKAPKSKSEKEAGTMRKRTAGSFPFVFFCAVAFCPPLWYGEAEENTEKGRDMPWKNNVSLRWECWKQNFLVKALCDAQKSSGPETSGEVQSLIDKTVNAPKGKLYLSDTEFQYAAQSLNGMRNAYLSAGRSSGGIDRVLAKLMSSKYRNVPVR